MGMQLRKALEDRLQDTLCTEDRSRLQSSANYLQQDADERYSMWLTTQYTMTFFAPVLGLL